MPGQFHKAHLKIGMIDRHCLEREVVALLLNSITPTNHHSQFTVTIQADNNKDFINQLHTRSVPDIVLLDPNNTGKYDFNLLDWLKAHHATTKVIVLSMIDDEMTIITGIKKGIKGYVTKNVSSPVMLAALESVAAGGTYYSDHISNKIIDLLSFHEEFVKVNAGVVVLNEYERTFINLTCTEFTYKEIAEKMKVSPRKVEIYRDELFKKLGLFSRIGLVLFAIKNKIYNPDTSFLPG